MNILFLIESLHSGGAEELLVNTVNEMVTFPGFAIHVVTIESELGRLKDKLSQKVKLVHFNCRNFQIFSGIKAIRNYIMQNNIQVVHAHLYKAVIASRFAVPSHVMLVATYHNMDFAPFATYYSRWRVWIEKFTYKQNFVSVYVSSPVAESVENIRKSKPGKSFVVPNFSGSGITPGYNLQAPEALKLVTIANFKKVKNIDFAIEALKGLKGYPISWDIIGNGKEFEELKNRIEREGVACSLKGWLPITNKTLAQYDLLVITSFDEGMPISLLEAMKFGMPSLLPDHLPGLKQMADKSAIYYSLKDITNFRNVVKGFLHDKNALKSMNESALQRAELFSSKKHIEKLLKIYRNEAEKEGLNSE